MIRIISTIKLEQSTYSMNMGGLGNQTTNYKFSDFYNVNTTLAGNSTWGGAYYSSGPMHVGGN